MFVNYCKEKKMLRILTAFILIIVLSACNTVEGIGKDIKKGGAAIEKSSK